MHGIRQAHVVHAVLHALCGLHPHLPLVEAAMASEGHGICD